METPPPTPSAPRRRRAREAPAPAKPAGKDVWDKIAALTVPFVSLVLGLLGAYATYTYNQTDLRQKDAQAKAALEQQKLQADADLKQREQAAQDARLLSQTQTLERLFVYISSDNPENRQFGYAMFAAMGQGELAAKLIGIKNDQAGVGVLRRLQASTDKGVSAAAATSLASLENATSAGSVTLNSRSSCREFAQQGFKAPRVPATAADYRALATSTGIEPAALAAFMAVETVEIPAMPDGRQAILFERQVFHRLTDGAYDQSHPAVSAPTAGGSGGPTQQYARLTEAASLNCPAALAATDWGQFQISGALYKQAGYANVDDFVKDVLTSGPKELQAALSMLQKLGVADALKNKDWALVARRYNGAGAVGNGYEKRLRDAYERETGKAG